MKIDWNTKYERTMNHTYMVLSKCDFFAVEQEEKEDYRVRMLLENRIPGILPVTQHRQKGENSYYYEINSLQSMSQMYEKEEIDAEALEILLHGCIRVFEKLEEYLLDGAQILLHPEYIYIHPDTKEPFFTYYPESDMDVREAFVSFVDYLLTRLDHTQEDTVMLGYQVYRYTRNPNFVLSEITKILSEHAQKKVCKQERRLKENLEKRVSMADAEEVCKNGCDSVSRQNAKENIMYEKKVYSEYEDESNSNNQVQNKTVIRNQLVKELLQVGKKEFIGVLISIGLTAVSCFVLFVIKVLKVLSIPYLYELYLCGILAMALVAAGMFAYSLHKKRQEWKEICQLQGRSNTHISVEPRSVCMVK